MNNPTITLAALIMVSLLALVYATIAYLAQRDASRNFKRLLDQLANPLPPGGNLVDCRMAGMSPLGGGDVDRDSSGPPQLMPPLPVDELLARREAHLAQLRQAGAPANLDEAIARQFPALKLRQRDDATGHAGDEP